jgi:hypothetical protein
MIRVEFLNGEIFYFMKELPGVAKPAHVSSAT